jgi:hydroxymethylpyrimidine pyrophosphatase-like HAD family hydrolase
VKLSVIAVDYDGTIASNGRAHRAALDAIRDARSRGIVVILVTGRILSDLRRSLPEHDIFDGIVAENGAVLAFRNRGVRTLGRPAPRKLFDALCRRRNVPVTFGECVIEADANAAWNLLSLVRELELPLVLHFNGNRVMLLPQGISKATGLREMLNALGVSLHNCVSIGDAENDYSMLEVCEIGAAVEWGSKSLHDIADDIICGEPETAVAEYIRRISANSKLPPDRSDRRRIFLDYTEDQEAVEIAVHGGAS